MTHSSITASSEFATLFERAVHLHKQGHFASAEPCYLKILEKNPNAHEVMHYLGALYISIAYYEKAIYWLTQAIRLHNKVASYYYHRALGLYHLHRLEEAVTDYQQAFRLNPTDLSINLNLGITYQDLGKPKQAIAPLQHALKINPSSVAVYLALGTAYLLCNKTVDALHFFDKGLGISPLNAALHVKRATCLLRLENYRDGFYELEWRFHSREHFLNKNPLYVQPIPRWFGESLEQSTILVIPEQGIGDEVMFASCFQELIARSKQCFIGCAPRLVRLFQRSFPQARIIPQDQLDEVSTDWSIFAGSLPYWFRHARSDFLGQPYLKADRHLRILWRERLAALGKKYLIGISWRGGNNPRMQNARSLPLQLWHQIFSSYQEIGFINLQYGNHNEEIAAFNAQATHRLHHFDDLDPLRDLDNFAALIAECDLVISIDNTTVHVAGALGVPIWVTLPIESDYRWLNPGSERSIWYNCARLFWEKTGKNKNDLLKDVCQALKEVLTTNQLARPKEALERVVDDLMPAIPQAISKQILLLNDTLAWHHWGYTGTSIALHQMIRHQGYLVHSIPISALTNLSPLPSNLDSLDLEEFFQYFTQTNRSLLETIQAAHVIYINGGESLQGLNPIAKGLLYLAYLAKTRFQKRVYIVNHSCDLQNSDSLHENMSRQWYHRVYSVLDGIAVREPRSKAELDALNIPSILSFDCLSVFIHDYFYPRLTQPIQKKQKFILLVGCISWPAEIIKVMDQYAKYWRQQGFEIGILVGAAAYLAPDEEQFLAQLQTHSDSPFKILYAYSEQQWLHRIAEAALLVSGQFHSTIGAACLNTPFLAIQSSNMPKISGVLDLLGLENAFIDIQAHDFLSTLITKTEHLVTSPQLGCVSEEVKTQMRSLAAKNKGIESF